jgi:hypothetical protein
MSNLGSISRLYENNVLSSPITVEERTTPVYLNLGDLYNTQVLRSEYVDTPIELTEEYLAILQVLEEEAEAKALKNPVPKPLGPYRLSLNQRRAIFDTMSKDQYNDILTNKVAARAFAAQVATVQRNEKYAKDLRDSLGIEEGTESPADGGNPYDLDAAAYFKAASITDPTALSQLSQFVTGIKQLNLWNSMVCWPLIGTQNRGTGSIAYALGGLGSTLGVISPLSGTLVGATWGTNGVTSLVGTSQGIFSTIGNLTLSAQSLFAVGRAIGASGSPCYIARNNTGGGESGMSLLANQSGNVDQAFVLRSSGIDGTGYDPIQSRPGTLIIPRASDQTVFRGRMATANAVTSAASIIRFESAPVTKTITLSGGAGPLTNADPIWIGRRAGGGGTEDNEIAFAAVFSTDISSLSSAVYTLYSTTLGSGLNLP